MKRASWRSAAISVAAAMTVAWTGYWFANRLIPIRYPGRLAYQAADAMPPRVDLASIQRGWPDELNGPGERNRLVAYMHDIERQPPPALAAPAVAAPTALVNLGALLASADANAGKAKARVCTTCHDVAPGGPDRIGPNLWGVIGRKVASRPGFAYSPAMAAQQGVWSYDRLFAYLAAPARAVPGNKMAFAGMRRPEDRAAVIKYLATLGKPPPLPKP